VYNNVTYKKAGNAP